MAEVGKRKRLGRGLDALFNDSTHDLAGDNPPSIKSFQSSDETQTAAIENLQPGRYQPRRYFDPSELDDLSESLKTHGIIQPILVRSVDDGAVEFEIIAGERRWRAAQLAKIHQVPIIVRDLTDSEALEIALVENLQRENLSPLEEAEGYRRLMEEFSHTQEALGIMLGKSRSHIANMMRLINLPSDIKTMVEMGKLSAGHGRALLSANDPLGLAQVVIKKGLNVRQTEKLVKNEGHASKPVKMGKGKDSDTIALESDLSAVLGYKVAINFKGPGGKLVIAYETLEQLDEIILRLKC